MPPYEFGRIEGDLSDRPVAIVACGPSMAGFDVNRLRGLCRVIAVKEMVFDVSFADLGFGLDLSWMTANRRKAELEVCAVPLVLCFPADERLWIDRPAKRTGITYIRRERGDTFSDDPEVINSGGNSGFGALNLAYLLKAKQVFLFGFDYCTSPAAHHFDNSRYPLAQPHGHWPGWARKFDQALPQVRKAGMSVINASPESNITAFPKVSHDEALDRLHRF